MRAAVFNGHWATLGGGEQLAGGVASALARNHDVELLVHEPFDAIVASERLGFDVTAFPQVELPLGTRAFLDASERYDLMVNTSFSNTFPNRAARGIYYVHFPIPDDRAWKGEQYWVRWGKINPLAHWIERSSGFRLREFAGNGCWIGDEAEMDLVIPRGTTLPFGLVLSANAYPVGRPPRVSVSVDGRTVFAASVQPGRPATVRTSVTGRGIADPIRVQFSSDTFVPRLETGSDDDRRLGVVVSHVYLGRRRPAVRPRDLAALRSVSAPWSLQEFLETYDVVAANSAYTANWVERLWGRPADVLSPPVRLRRSGPKLPILLSVGRFFPSESGHSKKQLELVEAFRRAVAAGLDGWQLHLAGGCANEHREYVESVRKAAVGLPVVFHVNARADDLDQLFATASIFWHAAGLGEDPERHPDRFEHFGISVVEAMSAGAVPVVYAHGGPAAIVGEGGCGLTYDTVDQLAERTVELVRAPGELERYAHAALVHAGRFGFDEFSDRLDELVARIGPGTARTQRQSA